MLLFICSTWSVRLGKGLSGHFSLCWWKCQVRGDGAWPQRWWNTFSSSTCSSSLTVSTENWLNVFNKKKQNEGRGRVSSQTWWLSEMLQICQNLTWLYPTACSQNFSAGPFFGSWENVHAPTQKNTNFVFRLTYFTYFKYNWLFLQLILVNFMLALLTLDRWQ